MSQSITRVLVALANVVLLGVAMVIAYALGWYVRGARQRSLGGSSGAAGRPRAPAAGALPGSHVLPNDAVASAIDALARQLPPEVQVDLLTLGSDTIRAALSGRGRAIDITRPRGAERCHVRIHSFQRHLRGRLWRRRVERRDVTHRYDVELSELGCLLALPLPGSTTPLFEPAPLPTRWIGQEGGA